MPSIVYDQDGHKDRILYSSWELLGMGILATVLLIGCVFAGMAWGKNRSVELAANDDKSHHDFLLKEIHELKELVTEVIGKGASVQDVIVTELHRCTTCGPSEILCPCFDATLLATGFGCEYENLTDGYMWKATGNGSSDFLERTARFFASNSSYQCTTSDSSSSVMAVATEASGEDCMDLIANSCPRKTEFCDGLGSDTEQYCMDVPFGISDPFSGCSVSVSYDTIHTNQVPHFEAVVHPTTGTNPLARSASQTIGGNKCILRSGGEVLTEQSTTECGRLVDFGGEIRDFCVDQRG